jgi:hypothetical protein
MRSVKATLRKIFNDSIPNCCIKKTESVFSKLLPTSLHAKKNPRKMSRNKRRKENIDQLI